MTDAGGCFENTWRLEICNDGEMTREGGTASHANSTSEPIHILPSNFDILQIFFKYFSTHTISVMQSAECQNFLNVINFN